jgi:hypothetical protein
MLRRSGNRLEAAFAELDCSLTYAIQATNLSFVLFFATVQCYLRVHSLCRTAADNKVYTKFSPEQLPDVMQIGCV